MSRRQDDKEYWMVAVLCAAFGVLSIEIFNTGYLAPFIAPDLAISNTGLGLLLAGFWVTYAIGSYLAGWLTDTWGHRRLVLIVQLLLVAAAGALSSLARTFAELLAARMLMGLLVGPFLPTAQGLLALRTSGSRFGLYTGLLQSLGNNLLAIFIAPSIVVSLAVHYGWRAGYLVAIAPALVCAALMAWVIREPDEERRQGEEEGRTAQEQRITRELPVAGGAGRLLGNGNFWICAVGAMLLVCYITVTMGFLPLWLVAGRGFTPERMSGLMSALGIAGAILGVGLPALSDRFGRKPTILVACMLGVIGSAAALFYSGPVVILAVLLFIGWAATGVCPLLVAVVPAESVPQELISTAVGLNVALASLVGGVAGPGLAGWAADAWGPRAPIYMTLAAAALAAFLSLFVRETAPRRVAARREVVSQRRLTGT